jgi:hypothetical protein
MPVDDGRLREEIQKKHGKSVEELYNEREKRLHDTITLKLPDRVPVEPISMASFFIVSYEVRP